MWNDSGMAEWIFVFGERASVPFYCEICRPLHFLLKKVEINIIIYLEMYAFFLLILCSIICSIMIYVCAIHTLTLEKQHSRKLNIWMCCTKTGCVSTKQQQYRVCGGELKIQNEFTHKHRFQIQAKNVNFKYQNAFWCWTQFTHNLKLWVLLPQLKKMQGWVAHYNIS